jgi:hypothetical protein
LCACDCGNHVTVRGRDLRTGNTRSCGCYREELRQDINKTHGQSYTHLYRIWADMKKRSNGKGSKECRRSYRGVTMCEEWKDFEVFLEWAAPKWKEGLVIDRENTLKGYSPDNCRFVTTKTNNQNSRRGKTWHVGVRTFESGYDASIFLGCSYSHVYTMCHGRIYKGRCYPPHDGCYTIKKYQEEQRVNA